jgi:hypothetical protein
MKNEKFISMYSSVIDAKCQGGQQENIFPVAFINIIGEVAVKRHPLKFQL